MSSDKHCFAFYLENLSLFVRKDDQRIGVTDREFIHRMSHVVRLRAGDCCILFDEALSVTALLDEYDKGTVFFICKVRKEHVELLPRITLCLGLVKKKALEEIVYNATQLGVTTIQLLATEKSQRTWGGRGEEIRLKKIMIAASEQSKQLIQPRVYAPLPLVSVLESSVSQKTILITFNPEGDAFLPYLEALHQGADYKNSSFVLCVGPEGGFSPYEMTLLQEHRSAHFRLTPTILRSEEAVTVGVGALRLL